MPPTELHGPAAKSVAKRAPYAVGIVAVSYSAGSRAAVPGGLSAQAALSAGLGDGVMPFRLGQATQGPPPCGCLGPVVPLPMPM